MEIKRTIPNENLRQVVETPPTKFTFSEGREMLALHEELVVALDALYQKVPVTPELVPCLERVAAAYNKLQEKMLPLLQESSTKEALLRERLVRDTGELAKKRQHLTIVKPQEKK